MWASVLRRGLTLVEVLVVVGIVTILIAAGFLIVPKAIASARDRACTNHLRQLGMVLIAYASDHDDGLPASRLQPNWTSPADYPAFKRALAPYGGHESLFYCPQELANPVPPRFHFSKHLFGGDLHASSYFYAPGYWLEVAIAQAEKRSVVRLSDVAQSPHQSLLMDVMWTQESSDGESRWMSAHGDRGVMVFADGHVRMLPLGKP